MDFVSIVIRLFFSAILGYCVMGIFGVQALVAVCSSVSLAKRRNQQFPEFDLSRALRRILRHVVIGAAAVLLISVLVIWLTSFTGTLGYFLGMILAFLRNLNRMTPNNRRNQYRFEKTFADCYFSDDEDVEEDHLF